MRSQELIVAAAEAGLRLDTFVAGRGELSLSRSRAQQLIESGHVTVAGRAVKAAYKVQAGDAVGVAVPEPEPSPLAAEAIPLDIVYEDAHLLVINKPRGLVVHPAAGHDSGTLVNALLGRGEELPGIGGVERPGIVHRLDKDTTGLMVVAKTEAAHRALTAQIQSRELRREYLALVAGDVAEGSGRIEAPIGRHSTDRKRMAVQVRDGREAVTHFSVAERFASYTLLLCRLETGRTHQIRVHLAYIGHPVVGDPVYGPRKAVPGLSAQFLHAARLGLRHPATGQWLQFEAPLPSDMAAVLHRLRAGGR